MIADQFHQSKWITATAAREKVHALRAQCDGLLVGVGTIVADDPSLNIRRPGEKERPNNIVILDPLLEIPVEAKVLQKNKERRVVLVIGPLWQQNWKTGEAKIKILKDHGVEILQMEQMESDKKFILEILAQELLALNFCHLFIEGGAAVYSSFLQANLVDRISHFLAPKILGTGLPHLSCFKHLCINELASALSFRLVQVEVVGGDVMIEWIRA